MRTARGRESLGHELAVIKRVMAIERYFAEHGPAGARVLTERDMRRDERRDGERRWAVGSCIRMAGAAKRWADYAVETPEGTTAVELEFSLKGTSRLRSIVAATRRRRTTTSWTSSCWSARGTRSCGGR